MAYLWFFGVSNDGENNLLNFSTFVWSNAGVEQLMLLLLARLRHVRDFSVLDGGTGDCGFDVESSEGERQQADPIGHLERAKLHDYVVSATPWVLQSKHGLEESQLYRIHNELDRYCNSSLHVARLGLADIRLQVHNIGLQLHRLKTLPILLHLVILCGSTRTCDSSQDLVLKFMLQILVRTFRREKIEGSLCQGK